MGALLQVSDLRKSFGERKAVDGVSFDVAAGQTIGLIGPNGAGKSTTVGMICGLLRPDGGAIVLDGLPMGAGPCPAKQLIGYVPQDLALYENLSARENLHLFASLYGLGGAARRRRCDEALALVNLADRARELPSTFSGGMKRRLNIAAAIMHRPQLLILDEPTVGVDPQSRNAIFETLERLQAEGCALIYTSHYMEEVERLADRIVIVDHGRVLADETPAALYARLPAQAALQLDLADAPSAPLLAALQDAPGVHAIHVAERSVTVGLANAGDAVGVMGWLDRHGCRVDHFATARTSLEQIFLTLTGRTLRD